MTRSKVAHIIGCFDVDSGGAQQVIKGICNGLSREAFEQSVIHFFGKATLASALPTGTNVHQVDAISRFYRPRVGKMRQVLGALNPDIVHVHSPIAGLAARPTARAAGMQCVTTIHNTGYALRHKLSEVPTLPLSDAIVGVSQRATELARQRCWARHSSITFRTIPNGIDLAQFAPGSEERYAQVRHELGILPHEFAIGLVGRLAQQKGQDIAIRALASLKQQFPHVKLVLVGRGEWYSHLAALAQALNVRDNVIFLGGRDDVARLYTAFDLCIFPSRWEGFGLAPVEAMAAARPTVAADIPVFQEVVASGATLVPLDPEQFAAKIAELLENSTERSKLGQRARACFQFFRRKYGRTVRATVSAFERLIVYRWGMPHSH